MIDPDDICISRQRYRELENCEREIRMLRVVRQEEEMNQRLLRKEGHGGVIFKTKDGLLSLQKCDWDVDREWVRKRACLTSGIGMIFGEMVDVTPGIEVRTYERTAEYIKGVPVFQEV